MSAEKNTIELITMLTNRAIPTNPEYSIEVKHPTTLVSWEYDTITYTSIWPEGNEIPLTLRSYRSPLTYWQTHDPKKPEKVWAVLRRLRLDSFPGPRPLAQGALGKTAYLIWTQPPGEIIRVSDDDFESKAKPIIPQLAELMARLHALDHNGLNNEPLYQATVAGTLVRMLLWSRESENTDLRQVITRLKPKVAAIEGWPHKLIHGDLHLANALVHGGQITTLLNWEDAAIGDPRWDVMTSAHWLRRYSPDLAEQLVNWYETFTGQTITDRPFWYALISVRLWALKGWLEHAIKTKKVSSECADWAKDLPAVKELAFNDLALAGL